MPRRTIHCASCGTGNEYDTESGKTFAKVVGAAGAVGGGWVGSSVGLALLGTAMSALIPLAVVGGLFAYRTGRKLAAPRCANCGAALR